MKRDTGSLFFIILIYERNLPPDLYNIYIYIYVIYLFYYYYIIHHMLQKH